jgi:hypothetical protein
MSTTTRTRRPRTPRIVDEETITIDQARRLEDAAIDAEARGIAVLGAAIEALDKLKAERAVCEARVARIQAERRAMLVEARQTTLKAAR